MKLRLCFPNRFVRKENHTVFGYYCSIECRSVILNRGLF